MSAAISYRYVVSVAGAGTWDATSGQAATYGPVDGLTLTRQAADTALWPSQAQPDECRFQLVLAQASDLGTAAIGSVVSVDLYRPAAASSPTEQFRGRVADLQLAPHQLGVLVTLTCLDYTADLRGTLVGTAAWPQETVLNRVNRILSAAGQPTATVVPVGGVYPVRNPQVAARAKGAADAYELVMSTLNQWAMDYGYSGTSNDQGLALPRLVPTGTDANGNVTGWQLSPAFESPLYAGPLVLTANTPSSGLWGVTAQPYSSTYGAGSGLFNLELPAAQVDWASSYAITKADAPSRIVVTSSAWDGQVVAQLGDAPYTTASISTDLVDQATDASQLAQLYLPSTRPAGQAWVADRFLWHLSLADAGTALPSQGALGTVVTIGGLPLSQSPVGREWYTGQLAGWTLTLDSADPTVELTLRRPDLPDLTPRSPLTLADMAAAPYASVRIADLNPRDTFADYRLTRRTA